MTLSHLLRTSIVAIVAASAAFAQDAPAPGAGPATDTPSGQMTGDDSLSATEQDGSDALPIVVDTSDVSQSPADQTPSPEAPTQEELTARAADYQMNRTSAVGIGQGARVVHTFDGSVARLVCQPLQICLIELEQGEEMTEAPMISDPVRWDVQVPIRDGSDGKLIKQYVAISPGVDAQVATLMVFTDRRVYPVQLIPDLLHHTFMLSYDYPDTRARENEERLAESRARQAAREAAAAAQRREAIAVRGVQTAQGAVPAEDLQFYTITGRANFKPLRVYTDRSKTYIDLPTDYRGDVPTIDDRSGGTDGTINARFNPQRSQIVVDRQLTDFYLRLGSSNVRVQINR